MGGYVVQSRAQPVQVPVDDDVALDDAVDPVADAEPVVVAAAVVAVAPGPEAEAELVTEVDEEADAAPVP